MFELMLHQVAIIINWLLTSDAIADDTGLKFADAVKVSKFPTVEKTVKVSNKVQNYEVAKKPPKKLLKC